VFPHVSTFVLGAPEFDSDMCKLFLVQQGNISFRGALESNQNSGVDSIRNSCYSWVDFWRTPGWTPGSVRTPGGLQVDSAWTPEGLTGLQVDSSRTPLGVLLECRQTPPELHPTPWLSVKCSLSLFKLRKCWLRCCLWIGEGEECGILGSSHSWICPILVSLNLLKFPNLPLLEGQGSIWQDLTFWSDSKSTQPSWPNFSKLLSFIWSTPILLRHPRI